MKDEDFKDRLELFLEEFNDLEEKYQVALMSADEKGAVFVSYEEREERLRIKVFAQNFEKHFPK